MMTNDNNASLDKNGFIIVLNTQKLEGERKRCEKTDRRLRKNLNVFEFPETEEYNAI